MRGGWGGGRRWVRAGGGAWQGGGRGRGGAVKAHGKAKGLEQDEAQRGLGAKGGTG